MLKNEDGVIRILRGCFFELFVEPLLCFYRVTTAVSVRDKADKVKAVNDGIELSG